MTKYSRDITLNYVRNGNFKYVNERHWLDIDGFSDITYTPSLLANGGNFFNARMSGSAAWLRHSDYIPVKSGDILDLYLYGWSSQNLNFWFELKFYTAELDHLWTEQTNILALNAMEQVKTIKHIVREGAAFVKFGVFLSGVASTTIKLTNLALRIIDANRAAVAFDNILEYSYVHNVDIPAGQTYTYNFELPSYYRAAKVLTIMFEAPILADATGSHLFKLLHGNDINILRIENVGTALLRLYNMNADENTNYKQPINTTAFTNVLFNLYYSKTLPLKLQYINWTNKTARAFTVKYSILNMYMNNE